ncbi:hypothetical protein CDAR_288261 [Caerostris darwini]|uniref:Uncharacterized protein n=1 Tax=Caerostris darwini TaxID=1538125 RepID=A0AAV4WAH1_9ARAC|nr:hypothetical protein CDAR_288261 [Caerostris darwini]
MKLTILDILYTPPSLQQTPGQTSNKLLPSRQKRRLELYDKSILEKECNMNEIDVIGHLIHPPPTNSEKTSPSRQKRRLELYDESILEKECNMNEIDDIGHLIHPPTNSKTNISFKTEKKIRTVR